MRTSVTLDADIYELASVYADAKGITLGTAIGELIRKGQAATPTKASSVRTSSGGFPMFPRRNRTITSAMVKEAIEEEFG